MRQHYSETDLLETYYTQPGESMPVMMHLADCADCAARYERLDHKIRALAAPPEMPETFWNRQRQTISARIAAEHEPVSPIGRLAAAAVLAIVVAGTLAWPLRDAVAPLEPSAAETIPADPWESEELRDLQPIVEWESWIETEGT
jgi:hypothetical protein